MNICDKCKLTKKTVRTFGKNVCLNCIEKRKTGIKGHSGMIYDASVIRSDYNILDKNFKLIKVKKSHPLFVKWYIEHYPKSKGIVGRQLNYLIYYGGTARGIISATSPPLNYKKFNIYFSKSNEISNSEFCKLFVNNGVFRIVDSPIKNFATQVLKIFRIKIKKDYAQYYGDKLKGIITFVEPPRTGSIYKADNWDCLGMTQGISVRRRGEDWIEKSYTKGSKKFIYAYKYHKSLRVKK